MSSTCKESARYLMTSLACLTKPAPSSILSRLTADKTLPMMKDSSVPCDWVRALHLLCKTTSIYTLSTPSSCICRAVKLNTGRSPMTLRNESGPGLLIIQRYKEVDKIPTCWRGDILLRIRGTQTNKLNLRNALLYLHRYYQVIELRHGISYRRPTDFSNSFVLGAKKRGRPQFMLEALKRYRNFIKSLERHQNSQMRALSKYGKLLEDPDKLAKRLRENRTKAFRWCILNDVPIAPIYLSNTEENSKCELTVSNFCKYFPRNIPVDRTDLQWTKEAMYSMTYPAMATKVSRCLLDHCNKPDKTTLRITDATANVGGNVISFSQYFKHVNAIELCPVNVSALCMNIRAYKLTNVTVHEGNCIDLLPFLDHDVVFFDPPWGGPFYKAYDRISLYLSEIPLETIILTLPSTIPVGIKAPYNFDIRNFIKVLAPFRKIRIVSLRGFQLILL